MDAHPPTPDVYVHVRIVMGIILGLGISRLLTGTARFIQHPHRYRVYPVHLAWALFLLLAMVHFWWFEFHLSRLGHWSFEIYLFVLFYGALYFLVCTLLFPDHIEEYTGYRDYFMSRRMWFFGLMAAIVLVDLGDSYIKGLDHFQSLGAGYLVRAAILVPAFVAGMFVTSDRYHMALVVVAIALQVHWIASSFMFLN